LERRSCQNYFTLSKKAWAGYCFGVSHLCFTWVSHFPENHFAVSKAIPDFQLRLPTLAGRAYRYRMRFSGFPQRRYAWLVRRWVTGQIGRGSVYSI
jgi:hypothetical protein